MVSDCTKQRLPAWKISQPYYNGNRLDDNREYWKSESTKSQFAFDFDPKLSSLSRAKEKERVSIFDPMKNFST